MNSGYNELWPLVLPLLVSESLIGPSTSATRGNPAICTMCGFMLPHCHYHSAPPCNAVVSQPELTCDVATGLNTTFGQHWHSEAVSGQHCRLPQSTSAAAPRSLTSEDLYCYCLYLYYALLLHTHCHTVILSAYIMSSLYCLYIGTIWR